MEIKKSAMELYKSALKTEINKRLGFHQIAEGIEEYFKNQSAGKIIFKPSLTPQGHPATKPANVNALVGIQSKL